MARADTILTAVQRIHEAALEPGGWTHTFSSIADAVRSQHIILFTQDAASRAVDSISGFGIAPEHLSGFAAVVNGGNEPAAMSVIPSGSAVRTSSVQRDREFRRSVLYNEVVRPVGAFYATAASLLRTTKHHAYCIVARRLGEDDYNADDVAVMRKLIPHFVSAMRVSDRLAAADLHAAGACAALDRLDVGVVLVDAAARILFTNRPAEAALAVHGGLGIDKQGLRAADLNTTRVLKRLICDCAGVGRIDRCPGGPVDIPRAADRAPLHVLVAPARSGTDRSEMAWLGAARPAAILIITDPERERRAKSEDLRLRFGLTAAEADVALEILKGDGRDAVAARLGVSMATVRTHLSHIFEKTGARRQAELVRLLMDGQRGGSRSPDEARPV